MLKYFTKFDTQAEYDEAKYELDYPNVSIVASALIYEETMPTPPTPQIFSGLTVYYNISNTSNEVTLFNGGGGSSSSESGGDSSSESGGGGVLPEGMIVDGVDETPVNTWRFSTSGQHIVQYSFNNPRIPQMFLNNTNGNLAEITRIEIGDAITVIEDAYAGEGVFKSNYSLTSVTIGSDVSYIGDCAFNYCDNLESVTVNVTTPPTLFYDNAFDYTNDCPIYVPSESLFDYQQSWYKYEDRLEAIQ
ncbi:MAG: leucine-rich repeat protein [Methanobrevibacter sp.]|nr:leucine-rich repeat protein [Methanobrevibacter sp.]